RNTKSGEGCGINGATITDSGGNNVFDIYGGLGALDSVLEIGKGNDTYRIVGDSGTGASSLSLTDTGGHNLIFIHGASRGVAASTLVTGTGNDTYDISANSIYGMVQSTLRDSGGNNLFTISGSIFGVSGGELEAGKGNDVYRIASRNETHGSSSAVSDATLTDNGGNNLFDFSGWAYGVNNATLAATAAKGNDTWRISGNAAGGYGISGGTLTDKGGNNLFDISGNLHGIYDSTLTIGAGNDTYRITDSGWFGLEKVSFTDKGGNNLFDISGGNSGISDSTLTIGAGNDTYRITGSLDSGISGGKLKDSGGNNLFDIIGGQTGVSGGVLEAGDGNDTWRITATGDSGNGITRGRLTDTGGNNLFVFSGEKNGALGAGLNASTAKGNKGNDTWYLSGKTEYGIGKTDISNSTLSDMGGNNLFVIHGKLAGAADSTLFSGAGNDTWRVTGTDTVSGKGLQSVSLTDTGGANLFVFRGSGGSGDNAVIADSTLNLGGSNTLNVFSGSATAVKDSGLTLGAGKDVLEIHSGVYGLDSVTLADNGGDNTLAVFGTYRALTGETDISLGGGNDLVTLASYQSIVMSQSTLRTGDGADKVFLEGLGGRAMGSSASIFTGAGKDLVSVRGKIDASSIDAGADADVIRLYSGAALANGAEINGGAGNDSLDLSLMECADLSQILANGRLKDVEVIDLSKNGGTALRVTSDDLGKILFSEEGAVPRVNGEKADTVYLVGGGWAKGGTSGGYTTYTRDGKSVQIKTGVKISFEDAEFPNSSVTLHQKDGVYTLKELTGDKCADLTDTIQAGSSFTFGDGRNTINFTGSVGDPGDSFAKLPKAVTIKTGSGDNAITLGKTTNLNLTAGGGNDTIDLGASMRGGILDAGNGWNNIYIQGEAQSLYSSAGAVLSRAQIKTGTGNDIIYLDGGIAGADIIDKGGDNTVTVSTLTGVLNGAGTALLSKALVQTGAGHDLVSIGGVTGATVDAGNGRNTVNVGGTVTSLHGTNTKGAGVVLAKGQIKTGTGDDSVTLNRLVGADITDAGGHNTVSISTSAAGQAAVAALALAGGAYQVAGITLGAGDDSLTIKATGGAGVYGANINLGAGRNVAEITGTGFGLTGRSVLSTDAKAQAEAATSLTTGAGDDVITIKATAAGSRGVYQASINAGAGNNTVNIHGEITAFYGSVKVKNGEFDLDKSKNYQYLNGLTLGAGHDSVTLSGRSGLEWASLDLGAGDNVLNITAGTDGCGANLAYIHAGAGADSITISGGSYALVNSRLTVEGGNNAIHISSSNYAMYNSTLSLGK
ncbi:hypothetical protein LJC26_08650, partial [Desulfovibrio sp. OttesenSCG-928-O18]|nr:hypothetical protein [Desulfovibrio sp. OttesenSCG-928-O18]